MNILLEHFNQEVENEFKCHKCSSCIDDPIFMTPNRSDIETIPEIFELEENYVQETPVEKKGIQSKRRNRKNA